MACCLFGAKPLSEPMQLIVNWSLGNKFQWNLNQNNTIFIQKNRLEYVVCKMSAILSQPLCVNSTHDNTMEPHSDNNTEIFTDWTFCLMKYEDCLTWIFFCLTLVLHDAIYKLFSLDILLVKFWFFFNIIVFLSDMSECQTSMLLPASL